MRDTGPASLITRCKQLDVRTDTPTRWPAKQTGSGRG